MEDIVVVLRDLDERMERARIEYMLVGSVLSGVYGEPRSTRDINVVVALSLLNVGRVVAAFRDGYSISPESVHRGITERSSYVRTAHEI